MPSPHRESASQIPLDDSSSMTMQAASVGRSREINTSYPAPKPFTLTVHTEINGIGSGTTVAVGITVGVSLALLAAALTALFFYVKRKIRGFADGSSKKNLRLLVETIVRDQASCDPQAGEAVIEHTMTSVVNDIHEVEEHRGGIRSHGQLEELDLGVGNGRAELV